MGSQREDALGFIPFSFSRLLSLQLLLFGGARGNNQRRGRFCLPALQQGGLGAL
ncbi:hypothetical protein E2320_014996, partial [Naja naja]